MTQTFTPTIDYTAKPNSKKQEDGGLNFAEPSENTLMAILNYSKNLEVKSSRIVKHIEFIKS